MMRNMSRGIPRLWKEGYKQFSGLEEAIFRNCEAATELAQVVRTSFGPNGLSKIIINRLEKVFVTTDAATIINELEVQHPAAKVLCLAAAMQQREIGDGANFVVVFAGELLKKALELLRTGLHPNDLVRGYNMAQTRVQAILKELCIYEIKAEDMNNKEKLMLGIKTAIASKQHGLESFLSELVADACLNSMPKNPKGFNIDNIRTVKILGSSVTNSYVTPGIVIESTPESTTRNVKDCKCVVFTCSVDATQTETKGTVLLHNAKELLNYNKSEEEHIHAVIKGLHEMGVRVIVAGEKIGEMALHFIDKYQMLAIRLMSKWTLRRLCRSLKARPCVQLAGVRPDDLGHVAQVATKEIGGTTVTIFSQAKSKQSPVSTIVIRGATDTVLQDIERAIDDGVNMVRAMSRNGKFVPGAGAAEIEMARRLRKIASETPGLEQYAIEKYAEALEVVPRTLAENTGLNDTEIISKLYKAHNPRESEEKSDAHKIGVDIAEGGIKDMSNEGVIDLMATRQMGIKLASQAAVTILRVDHIIMKKPAGGPRPRKRGHWDDNDDTW